MFRKPKTYQIVVTPAGLINLIRKLSGCDGLYNFRLGPSIRAFPQSSGNFVVTLEKYQAEFLMSKVPSASIEMLVEPYEEEEVV